jgi:hypothetical protein
VQRIDALFAIEREINGLTPAARQARSAGGQRAAIIFSLIVTAKLNDVDPQA